MKNLLYFLFVFLFVCNISVVAQERVITGIVTSAEDNSPLIGATVILQGTSTGATTNAEGKYEIKVPQNGAILVFTYVGFLQEVKEVGTDNLLNVSLITDIQSLNEVVVVGYGTQRKSDLTGAVSSITSDDIQRTPVTSADQILQGHAAGVTVTSNSGTPGGNVLIRVRGVGTINDASPLFVVDGFPLDDISFLNSSDIASMEILKDASATAIYGSRGANGVIMITTRNGKTGQTPVISFDSYYGISEMWRKPELLTARQWAQLHTEAEINGGTTVTDALSHYENFGKGTDWMGEVTRKAASHNVNLSISGGSDKFTYFASANNYLEEGIVKKTDFNRNSFRLNTTIEAKKWLTIGENLTIEYSKQRKVNEDDEWSAILIRAVTSDPTTPVKRENGYYSSSDYVQMTNPVAGIAYTNANDVTNRLVGNIYADIKLLKDLSFKSNMGVDYSNYIYNDFEPTFELYYSDGTVNSSESRDVSSISRSITQDKSWSWSNYFTYAKQFNQHNLSVMAGMEASEDKSDPFSGQKSNLVSENKDLINFGNALDLNGVVDGFPTDHRMASYFGRLNYYFGEKYLFTANIRRDGSTNFGAGKRYGIFPSFSAGWRLDKENFLSQFDFISNLKLRAGWGEVGNEKITAFGFANNGFAGSKYVFGNEIRNGVYFPGIANKNLHWEATNTLNIGVDFGVLQNKLSFSVDYYDRETSDMLVNVPVPYHSGIQTIPYRNIGTMENKGFEFVLDFKNVKGDFSYDIGANLSTNKNKVTSLGEESEIQTASLRNGGYVSMTQVGEPIAQFWGYKTDGLFQTEDDIKNWKDNNGNLLQPEAVPGDIRYAKNDTGGLYMGKIGNPLPKFSYGINLNFEYKNIDLTIFCQGVYGNEIFNGTMVYTDRPDVATNLSTRMLDRWTEPYSTNDAHHPRLSTTNASNILYSDRYVEDGSYFRVKNLQLGYTLPQKLSQSFKVQKFRVYVGAVNLLTFTKYQGFDPEIGIGYSGSLDLGIDRATYPQARTFMAGVNLVF